MKDSTSAPALCLQYAQHLGGFDEQAFIGLGTSKKMAVKVAAEQAWGFVQGTKAADAFQHMQASQDLWGAICSALTADVSSML